MQTNKLSLLWAFIFVSVLFASASHIFGQTAGTDMTEKGRTYFEGNLWTGTQSHANGGMQVYGGRFAYGLRKNLEVGIGFSMSNPHDEEYPPELQPSVKYKFYENEKYGVRVAGGVVGYIPIARRDGTNAFAMTYTNVSKDVKKLKDARFTAGGYVLVGRNQSFGSRKGWNFMYEQPINNKAMFSTQWTTGNNRFGFLTPGFNISTSKKSSLFVGYSVGNKGYDNHGPYFSFGVWR